MSIYESIGEALGSTARDARTINESRINPEWGEYVPEYNGYINRLYTYRNKYGERLRSSTELCIRRKLHATS